MSYQFILGPPPTNELTIIFPFDQVGNQFDSGFYSPALTGETVSIEEINQILSEIDATRKSIASKRINAIICYIVSLVICSGIFVPGLLYVATSKPDIIAFMIIAYIVALFTVVTIFMCRVQKLKGEVMTKCKEVVDKHNQNFMFRGLRWHLPVSFPAWVELWKDYQSQNETKKQQTDSTPPERQLYTPASDQSQQNYSQDYQGQSNQNLYIPPQSEN